MLFDIDRETPKYSKEFTTGWAVLAMDYPVSYPGKNTCWANRNVRKNNLHHELNLRRQAFSQFHVAPCTPWSRGGFIQ